MQFIAALFEHFVVGVVALVWLVPLSESLKLFPVLCVHKDLLTVAALPIAYVLGMFIDVLASVAFSGVQWLIKKYEKPVGRINSFVTIGTSRGQSYANTVRILKNSPDELAKYLLQLSAREKIARGVALNFFLAIFANLMTKEVIHPLFAAVLATCAVYVALRFKALTDTFKAQTRTTVTRRNTRFAR